MIEYQSLFYSKKRVRTLHKFRQIEYKTMMLLKKYNPRLIGPVLTGAANQYSEIIIHVFSDTSEFISLFLENEGIPIAICERRLQIEKNNYVYFTAFKCITGDINIVLVVLPPEFLETAPVDPGTGQPMKRARLNDVKKLINQQ